MHKVKPPPAHRLPRNCGFQIMRRQRTMIDGNSACCSNLLGFRAKSVVGSVTDSEVKD
jgi:hypothetical protein